MEFNPEKVMQGIEVEGYLRTREQILSKINAIKEKKGGELPPDKFASEVSDLIGITNLYKEPHYDTGHCTEIDLLPHDNLGDFADDLRTIISTVYEYAKEKDYLYMLSAENPVAWFAGAHQHLSIPHKTDGANYDIRNKLYVFQPFISLLGQNSNFEAVNTSIKRYDNYARHYYDGNVTHKILSHRKDSRIMSYTGGFGLYDSDEDDEGMLSPDHEMGTMEVRYPSSSSLLQAISMATFLKACLFQKGNSFQEEEYDTDLETLCRGIPLYGSLTPVEIRLPKWRSTVSVNLGQVFQMMIKSNSFAEGLDRALGELDTRDVSNVLKFFNMFNKGFSMTDYYDSALENVEGIMKQCEVVHDLGEEEFLKGKLIIDRIDPVNNIIIPPFDSEVATIDSRIFDITNQVKKLVSVEDKKLLRRRRKYISSKRKIKKEKQEESKWVIPTPEYIGHATWEEL